ncbi:MAG: AIR synthase related protein [Clostridiales bacterium]|nr:MAG: AIR synthase related protein [Clostridiales bacterium]
MRIGKTYFAGTSKIRIRQKPWRKKSGNPAIGGACGRLRGTQNPQKFLLLTTDPITATGNNAGRLAITVSANDVAVSGGTPLCCLLTIIAPTTASAEDVGKFMKEAHETAEALGVDIVGGHTEFSEAVNRMVVSCTMLGTTRRIVKSSGAKAGDSIVMTKSAAIEATAIMANDHADKLLKNGLTTEELVEAREYIAKVSVVEDAKIVWKHNVSCMHDVTEGGVFGAVTELAEASGLGAMIYADQIPVTHLTAKKYAKSWTCRRCALSAAAAF